MVKNVSCVSCAAWNVSPINSLLLIKTTTLLLSLAATNEQIKCPGCLHDVDPTEFVDLNIFGNESASSATDFFQDETNENISNYNWLNSEPLKNIPLQEVISLNKNKMPLEISKEKPKVSNKKYKKRLRLPKLKKEHVCAVCEKDFKRNCDLARHILLQHSEEN